MSDIAIYDGAAWQTVFPFPAIPITGADVQIAPTAPTPRAVGDMWIDSDDTLLTWDTDWINLTLLNGWTEYSTTYGPGRYRKTLGGVVYLDGMIKGGTAGTVATLPAGYRPSKYVIMPNVIYNSAFGRLNVDTSGNIVATGYSTTWTSLASSFAT